MNNNPSQPDQPAQEPQSTYNQSWQQPPIQPNYNQQPSSPQYGQPQSGQQWNQQPPQYGQAPYNQQWGQQTPPQYGAVPDYARPQPGNNNLLVGWLVSSLVIRLLLTIVLPLFLCGGAIFIAILFSAHH